MQPKDLQLQIENIRNEINLLTERYPLSSGIVLSKSRQLDQLLNEFRNLRL